MVCWGRCSGEMRMDVCIGITFINGWFISEYTVDLFCLSMQLCIFCVHILNTQVRRSSCGIRRTENCCEIAEMKGLFVFFVAGKKGHSKEGVVPIIFVLCRLSLLSLLFVFILTIPSLRATGVSILPGHDGHTTHPTCCICHRLGRVTQSHLLRFSKWHWQLAVPIVYEIGRMGFQVAYHFWHEKR